MRRFALTIGLASLVAFPWASLHAWGIEGHHIIARVAWSQMTPAARRAAQTLLGSEDFVAASTWADEILSARPDTYNWHFVNIPYDQFAYDAARDCQPSPRGDCIVAELDRVRRALADETLPAAQRREALKFLIHFVGDVHQPLHAISNNDRGGNEVRVVVAGRPAPPNGGMTLHAAWDTVLIGTHGLDADAYAGTLVRDINQYPLSALPIDFAAWASDAHQRAIEYAYTYPGFTPGRPPAGIVTLGTEYQHKAELATEHQIELAGVRLAALVNQALASGR